ncbi:carboxypeptidase regulatory-like domain-containing protein, partial [Candidatus Woesearchaeota archaeon]
MLILAAPLFVAFSSTQVSADFGCCVHPVASASIFVCSNIDDAACCGTDPSVPGYDLCNTSFVAGNANCFDENTPVPECLNGFGCCIYEGQGCADTQYEAQCSGDEYYPNTDCSDVPVCEDVCCVWYDPSDPLQQYCEFVSQTECYSLDQSPSFPSSYVGVYTNGSNIAGVTSPTECSQRCGSFDVRPSNITGFITDSSGSPLESASVSNGQTTVTTDSSGRYE